MSSCRLTEIPTVGSPTIQLRTPRLSDGLCRTENTMSPRDYDRLPWIRMVLQKGNVRNVFQKSTKLFRIFGTHPCNMVQWWDFVLTKLAWGSRPWATNNLVKWTQHDPSSVVRYPLSEPDDRNIPGLWVRVKQDGT